MRGATYIDPYCITKFATGHSEALATVRISCLRPDIAGLSGLNLTICNLSVKNWTTLSLVFLFSKPNLLFLFFVQVKVPDPIAHYPLNSKYATREIKNRQPQGTPAGIRLEAGPDSKAGGSYQFEGKADSYIEFPNTDGGLDAKYSMTMLCWVYPQNSEGPIFNYKTSGEWGVHMWMVAGKLFARFTDKNYLLTPYLISSQPLPLNQWYYVGASYDHNSGIAKLWLNGQQVLQRDIGAQITLGTQDSVRMGAKGGDHRYFKGRVTDMKIYDVALTMEQINTVKHANQGNLTLWSSV